MNYAEPSVLNAKARAGQPKESAPLDGPAVEAFTSTMDSYTAVGYAEGFIECPSEEAYIAAWQYLIDTGMAWTLQGWFGRTAVGMIEAGHCRKA